MGPVGTNTPSKLEHYRTDSNSDCTWIQDGAIDEGSISRGYRDAFKRFGTTLATVDQAPLGKPDTMCGSRVVKFECGDTESSIVKCSDYNNLVARGIIKSGEACPRTTPDIFISSGGDCSICRMMGTSS